LIERAALAASANARRVWHMPRPGRAVPKFLGR